MQAHLLAIAGLVLLAAELLLPGIYLLWIGLALLGTAAAQALLGLGFAWLVLCFIGMLGLAVGLGWRLQRGRRIEPDINDPARALHGQTGPIILGENGQPMIRLGDTIWPVRAVAGVPPLLAAGTLACVQGAEGGTLLVAPVATPQGG